MSKIQDTEKIFKIPLKQLYLDPNNYRFINDKNYKVVAEDEVTDERVQLRSQSLISGSKRENIKDLINSFKTNGYLNVDQIQVQKIDDKAYKVLEGNRRVTALKYLQKEYLDNLDIGELNPSIFRKVPVVSYDDKNEANFYLLTGLKHIEGNKKWPTINQARLVYDLINKYGLNENEIVDRLGTTKQKVRRYLRTLNLIDEYLESDYGDQFNFANYSIFEEIVRKPVMRNWLGWDEETMLTSNQTNRDRLFSWLSQEEENLDPDGDEDVIRIREKIIAKATDIRELAQFINDDLALNQMEKSGTVSSGYLASDQILTDKFNRSLDIVKDQIKEAFVVADYADDQSRNRLEQIRNQLDGLIMSKGFSDLIDRNILSKNVLVNYDSSFFTDIDIKCYRGISGLTLKKLEQINVFTGANNAGKTSVLEAIYLLAQQNNSDAFFDVLRRRAKLDGLDAVWVDSNFTDTVEVSGIYNDVNASNKIYKSVEESDLIDKSDYLSTIMMEGEFGSNVSNSRVELYEHSKQKTFVKSINVICNATLSSPFSLQNSDTILQAHASSVKSNTMKKIIEFISINIDSGIQDIQLSDSGRGRRFNVTHSDFENKSLDLSQFGDGLQRVFFISLLFSSAKNGIILIDELENAIHYKLLTKFSAFIQQLAKEFNVQVFITSHSNECVEALMSTSSSPNDIVFYHLDRTDNEVKAKRLTGGRYKELLTVMEIDLR